ncbi:MAG: hypothetical protein AB8B56_17805 [Crocinitomicaceae bacterium]
MKYLLYISPIPLILFIIAIFLPFIEHQYEPGVKIVEYGYDFGMVFLPLGIMVLILSVANIKRGRFTAIIAFVLCFGLLFSLFLMQFPMRPMIGTFTLHTYRIGYPMAFFSAVILMIILLVNLVKTFRNPLYLRETAN